MRRRRAGRRLALLTLLLATASPALVAGNIGLEAALGGAAAVLIVLWMGLIGAGWLGARQITRVVWQADGLWRLTDRRGQNYEATLRPDTRMSTSFIWLHWNLPNFRDASMLLAAGDAPADELRRLRIRLKLDRRAGGRATSMRTTARARKFTA
ncbi:MAG TPA: hypothetical protein VNQ81_07540 [Povalibacter sp.]|nr:hypothetical protein [Povalibacter sp.]